MRRIEVPEGRLLIVGELFPAWIPRLTLFPHPTAREAQIQESTSVPKLVGPREIESVRSSRDGAQRPHHLPSRIDVCQSPASSPGKTIYACDAASWQRMLGLSQTVVAICGLRATLMPNYSTARSPSLALSTPHRLPSCIKTPP